jgi:hypothetical protein
MMLTGMVTIAVFAAFRPRVMGALLSNAEFKRVCRDRQLDVLCYEWQKRQRSGKIRQEVARSGKVSGKNGTGGCAIAARLRPDPGDSAGG